MNTLQNLLEDAENGRRLTTAEAQSLFEEADLLEVGQAAAKVVQQRFPANTATFIIDRNITPIFASVAADFALFTGKDRLRRLIC
jgi:2-iminoacetate synthase ThiH